jgi:hypothetical protein
MVTNLPVEAGEEVFNTYGEHLSNAELLACYGFMLDENENDVVRWKLADLPWRGSHGSMLEMPNRSLPRDISPSGGKQGETVFTSDDPGHSWRCDPEKEVSDEERAPKRRRILAQGSEEGLAPASDLPGTNVQGLHHAKTLDLLTLLVRQWPHATAWDASDLVFVVEPTATDGAGGEAPTVLVQLNADGKVSHHLWMYAAVVALLESDVEVGRVGGRASGPPKEEAVERRAARYLGVLRRAAEAQLLVERESGRSDGPGSAGSGPDGSDVSSSMLRLLARIARELVRLCEWRRRRMVCASSQEVNERLDVRVPLSYHVIGTAEAPHATTGTPAAYEAHADGNDGSARGAIHARELRERVE